MYRLCTVPTSVMGLHSLKSMAQHTAALDVDWALFGVNGALDAASGPEVVVHRPPWLLGVGTVIGGAILSTHKSRRGPGELYIYHAVLSDGRLDGVLGAILGELNGDAIGEEGVLLLVEAVVVDGVACPEEGLLVVREEELAVELHSHTEATMQSKHRSEAGVQKGPTHAMLL